MPYTPEGKYWRMKSSGILCSVCRLPFLEGKVALPDSTGRRVCRDCRRKESGADALRAQQTAQNNHG